MTSGGAVTGADTGGVTGWMLRVWLAVAGAAAIATAMAGAPDIGVLSVAGIVMMILVLGTTFAPGSVMPLLLLIGVVIYRVAAQGPVLDLGLAALVLLIPLIHQLSGIAAAIPVRSECRWPTLRPAAARLLIAVAPVEIALLAAVLLG